MAVNRDSEGHVIVHRAKQDDEVTITETLIGMIGYAQNSGYLGSSIYLTLNYNEQTEEEIKDIFKREVQSNLTLNQENEKTLKIEFTDIRRLLDDEGMHYRRGTRGTPKFLLSGPEVQRKSYVKGLILGSLDQETLDHQRTTGELLLHLTDYETADSMRKLIEQDGGEAELNPKEVTIRIPPSKQLEAYMNQNIQSWTEGL